MFDTIVVGPTTMAKGLKGSVDNRTDPSTGRPLKVENGGDGVKEEDTEGAAPVVPVRKGPGPEGVGALAGDLGERTGLQG